MSLYKDTMVYRKKWSNLGKPALFWQLQQRVYFAKRSKSNIFIDKMRTPQEAEQMLIILDNLK